MQTQPDPICKFCGRKESLHTRCRHCGYSECDELIHGDHRLCLSNRDDEELDIYDVCARQHQQEDMQKRALDVQPFVVDLKGSINMRVEVEAIDRDAAILAAQESIERYNSDVEWSAGGWAIPKDQYEKIEAQEEERKRRL